MRKWKKILLIETFGHATKTCDEKYINSYQYIKPTGISTKQATFLRDKGKEFVHENKKALRTQRHTFVILCYRLKLLKILKLHLCSFNGCYLIKLKKQIGLEKK